MCKLGDSGFMMGCSVLRVMEDSLRIIRFSFPLVSAHGFVGLRVRPNSVGWTVSIVVVEWLSGLVVVSVRPFFGFGEVLVHLSKGVAYFSACVTEGRKVFILDMSSELLMIT